jgi:quinohemoprotein ethanol dehydrogenase
MAYNPDTGLVYIPAMDAPMGYAALDELNIEPGLRNRGVVGGDSPPGDALFHSIMRDKISAGYLLAWDPVKQQERWKVRQDIVWNGGVLTTAGNLVIQGTGSRAFSVYNAETGEKIWSFAAQNGIIAPPVTYEVDGEQYITVLAGWGGAYGLMSGFKPPAGAHYSRILTFKLGGSDSLPPIPKPAKPDPLPARITTDSERIERGSALYHNYCSYCHGVLAVSGDGIIDLRKLPTHFHNNFDLIARQGAMATLGMPSFGDVLNEQDVEDIHAYVIDRAYQDRAIEDETGLVKQIRLWLYELLSWLVATIFGGSSSSA